MRVSDVLSQGDAIRRASTRLVADGLESDIVREYAQARGSYERAIQIDPTNPLAYLALARHYIELNQPERGLALIDQAAALFESDGWREPRVGVHLIGLRGIVFYQRGETAKAESHLGRAAAMAPAVWGDRRLAPAELL